MSPILALIALCLAPSSDPTPPQQSGEQGIYQRSSLQQIESKLAMYLNGEANDAILTPGETVDWKLNLKAGDVVVADASSQAFDPALQLSDNKGKVLADNDDRYPGDQRPLLFWRCPSDGEYKLSARCYKDKTGGQVSVRFNTYTTLDIEESGKFVQRVVSATKPFMVRVPMKAGQVKDLVYDKVGQDNFINYRFQTVISPNGLPERDPALSAPLSPAILALVAPLAGDYYLLYTPFGYRGGEGYVRIATRDYDPRKLTVHNETQTASAPDGAPALFELNVRAGDLLEAATSDLNLGSVLLVSEAPDFAGYAIDPKHPELNPFFPVLREAPPARDPAFDLLPSRRGGRIAVLRARRDARLWIASDGNGPSGKDFQLTVKPAALEFREGDENHSRLIVGKYDYWAFNANAGDVMTFKSTATDFNQVVVVRDPNLGELRHQEAQLDQTADEWRMVVQRPGRYLLQISCLGDGGSGDYSLSRSVLPPREFAQSSPAKAEIAPGEIQIWKFTATPENPLFVHWTSSDWNFDVAIYDEKGNGADFQRTEIDAKNRLGILKVNEPKTFLIVLTGKAQKSSYQIELLPIPVGAGT